MTINQPTIKVRLFASDKSAIDDASVVLETASGALVPGAYNREQACFEIDASSFSLAPYEIKVEKKGFQNQVYRGVYDYSDDLIILFLAALDEEITVLNNSIQPYQDDAARLAVFGNVKQPSFEQALVKQGLELIPTEAKEKEGSTPLIRKRDGQDFTDENQEIKTVIETLTALAGIKRVGSILEIDRYGIAQIFSPRIRVQSKSGIFQVKSVLKTLPVQIKSESVKGKQAVFLLEHVSSRVLNEAAVALHRSGSCEFVSVLTYSQAPGDLAPADLLWGGDWSKKITGVETAFDLLDADPNAVYKFGDPDLITAVIDFGINSTTAGSTTANNVDFQGNVTNGKPKMVGWQDFDENNFVENNDPDPMDISSHGVGCAGIIAGNAENANMGIAGVAPNTRLMGIIATTDDVDNARMIRWLIGYESFTSNLDNSLTIPKLPEGAGILHTSRKYTVASGFVNTMNSTLDIVTNYGRNGRGSMFFASGGNDEEVWALPGGADPVRWSTLQKICGVTAASYDATGNEVRSTYSNWSPLVDFCAPSDPGGGGSHNPPARHKIWTVAAEGKGNLPGDPASSKTATAIVSLGHHVDDNVIIENNIGAGVLSTTTVTGTANLQAPAPFDLNVVSSADFSDNQWIQIEDNVNGVSWVQVDGVPPNATTIRLVAPPAINPAIGTTITGYVRMWVNDHTTPTPVVVGDFIIFRDTSTNSIDTVEVKHLPNSNYMVTTAIAAASGGMMGNFGVNVFVRSEIQFNNLVGISVSDKVLFGAPSYNQVARTEVSEGAEIVGIDAGTNRVYVGLRKAHAMPLDMYFGDQHWQDDFGGTSAAAPFAAGVAALVLTAKPSLTWIEARQILRDTAVKIDPDTPGFQDAAKFATHPQGTGIWRDAQVGGTNRVNPVTQVLNPAVQAVYSDWYGYGRLDAAAAVAAAIAYSHDDRDLMIRDSLNDTGAAANPAGVAVDSPDVWVRNIPAGSDPFNFGTLPFGTPGPHRDPLEDTDRVLYARIRNRGTADPNLDAEVRFYLVLDNPGTTFKFPDHFKEINNTVTNGNAGVLFIGKAAIPAGTINQNSEHIVSVPWPVAKTSGSGNLESNILVQVTPHDGEYFDAAKKGELLKDNNNITRKRIKFTENIQIKGDTGALPIHIDVPSTAINTAITTNVKITVSDYDTFTTEDVEVKATIEYKDSTNEVVTFKHTGSWGFDIAPTGGWVTFADPQIEPFGVANPATGTQYEVLFDGSFEVTGTVEKVTFEAKFIDNASVTISKQKSVNVDVQFINVPGTAEDPVEKNKIYFFTEYDKLTSGTQTDTQAYGPTPSNATTEFQTTSKHPSTVDSKAFAVTDGQLLVQRTSDPSLVNVILKPRAQGSIDFLDVKYFIYRGILKSSIIDTNEEMIAPANTNDFMGTVWDTQDKINRAIENADPNDGILPNTINDVPPSKAFGYHYTATASVPGDVVKADTESLDDLFFDPIDEFKFPPISKGQEFGQFKAGNIGFDIILSGMANVTTLGEVRGVDNTITATNLPANPTAIQKLTNWSTRSKILNFMDPAAFYGIHYRGGVNAINTAASDDLYREDDLFDNLLDLFYNQNRTYIDIRNENGYYFNYSDNYTDGSGNEVQLSFDSSVSPTAQEFGTDGWPIRIVENGDFETGVTGEKNIMRLQLPEGDNSTPLLYLSHGPLYNKFPKPSKRKKRFQKVKFNAPSYWSEEFEFGVPNRSGNGATTPMSWYIKLEYVRKNDQANVGGNSSVVNGLASLDHAFPMLEPVPWQSSDSISYVSGFHNRYIERADFAFWGDIGVASEQNRVMMYAVPEEVYAQAGKRTSLFKRILGGTSSKDSFFAVLKDLFPNFTLQKRELTIGGLAQSVLAYAETGLNEEAENDKRNIFSVGMSRAEYDSLLMAGATASLDNNLHFPVLVTNPLAVTSDDNGNAYKEYGLKIGGLNTSGDYVTGTTTVTARSVDGIMITTHDFADPEGATSQIEDCITFEKDTSKNDYQTRFGSVIKRVAPFTTVGGTPVNSWDLVNAAGQDITYDGGEVDNFGVTKSSSDPVKIPVGTRCVMLFCSEIPVEEHGSFSYIRIVCWHGGGYRTGYINKLAFENSNLNRVLPSDQFTDDEVFDCFMDDARLEMHLMNAMSTELSTHATFAAMMTDVNSQLSPTSATSLIGKYVNGSSSDKALIARRIRGEGNSLGLAPQYYVDDTAGYRMNFPDSVEKYMQIIADAGLIQDARYTFLPLFTDFVGDYSNSLPINFPEFKTWFDANCPNLVSEIGGRSGASHGAVTKPDEFFDEILNEMKAIRTWFAAKKTANANDPILKTPESKWFLDSSRGDSAGSMGGDYYDDDIYNLQFLHNYMMTNPKNPGQFDGDVRAAGILIDQSFGPMSGSNILSVFFHELNVSAGINVVSLPGDTHMGSSEVPNTFDEWSPLDVSASAWEYVKANTFTVFEGHGFKPHANYTDTNGKHLGFSNNSKTENIADFFQRNPSLGTLYLKYYLDKILTGL